MLAKAGESDRAIRVKMVRSLFFFGLVLEISFGSSYPWLDPFLFLCFIFDANMTFIFAFLHDFFF